MKSKLFTTLFLLQFPIYSYSENPQLKDNFVPSNLPAAETAAKTTSTTIKENVVKAESKKDQAKKSDSKSMTN